MTTEERRNYIYDTMKMALENNNDLMIEVVESMDSYDGFLNDDHLYYMSELDEILYGKKPSEIIDMITGDFDSSCEWFYFSIYGLESCDDKAEFYLDNLSIDEILDTYIDRYYNYKLYEFTGFEELAEILDSYTDDDTEEENDEKFKERIDDLYAEL